MRPHARKGSKRCQSAQEKIDGLKTRMGIVILAKIRRQVVVFDQAHAVVQYYDTDTSSKISCHIQALWRAIMDVEQAIELYGVDVETIEQRCSNKSATSSLSTLSTRPSIDAYETDFAVSELDSGYHSFIIL